MAPKNSNNPKKSKRKNHTTAGSSSSRSSCSSAFSFEVGNTPLPQTLPGGPYQAHPWRFEGPKNAFEAKTVEGGFYVRIDMPGVSQDSVEVKFENKKIFFCGKAPKLTPYESGPRHYHGEITFTSEPLEVFLFKFEMKKGVLRMNLVGTGFPEKYYASSSHRDPVIPTWGDTFNQMMLGRPDNFVEMYPFQLDGAQGTCEMRPLDDDYFFLRTDVPDVDAEGLSTKFTDRKMVFCGTGVKASEYDESKRQFYGGMDMLCPCECKYVELQEDVSDGVARLVLKKERVKPLEKDRAYTVRPWHC